MLSSETILHLSPICKARVELCGWRWGQRWPESPRARRASLDDHLSTKLTLIVRGAEAMTPEAVALGSKEWSEILADLLLRIGPGGELWDSRPATCPEHLWQVHLKGHHLPLLLSDLAPVVMTWHRVGNLFSLIFSECFYSSKIWIIRLKTAVTLPFASVL